MRLARGADSLVGYSQNGANESVLEAGMAHLCSRVGELQGLRPALWRMGLHAAIIVTPTPCIGTYHTLFDCVLPWSSRCCHTCNCCSGDVRHVHVNCAVDRCIESMSHMLADAILDWGLCDRINVFAARDVQH